MRKLKNILFLYFIFIITVAFNFKDNPPSGWYQQFLPNINGQSISDMLFLDSLNGFLITESTAINDTSYILKTTNGGDNWVIKYRAIDDFSTIKFVDSTTGFLCGGDLYKTTNEGENWFTINRPNQTRMDDMSIWNADTLWVIDDNSLTGGVFRTTNGGVNWTQQLSLGNFNPNKIYFYNARIGFIGRENGTPNIRKTTNGGENWTLVLNGETFTDIHFTDSLNGLKCSGEVDSISKTSNGGISWYKRPLPKISPGLSNIKKFAFVNKDTIWGVNGRYVYPNNQARGVLYTSTNGGDSWYYQVPDTTVHLSGYFHIQFINKNFGWAYSVNSGIKTKVGGDPLIAINPVSLEIPNNFKLEQNYPNPFNPTTIINYQLTINSFVTLKVFDLQGREIQTLVNRKQSTGHYSAEFNAANLSSGIYFYTLQTEDYKETKKMILVK